MITTLIIIGYIVSYIISYYLNKKIITWVYPTQEWTWNDIRINIGISLFSIPGVIGMFLMGLTYKDFKTNIKPPKWL